MVAMSDTYERVLPNDAKLDELAEICRKFADRQLDGSNNSVNPHLFVWAFGVGDREPGLELSCLAMPFNSAAEKAEALRIVGRSMYGRRKAPLAVFLMSEAWSSAQAADEPRKYALPEQDPQRKEVLIYTGCSTDGRFRHGSRVVRRDAESKMHIDGDWQITEPQHIGGLPLVMRVFEGFDQGRKAALTRWL